MATNAGRSQLCLIPSSQSEGQLLTVQLGDLIDQRIEHVKQNYDGQALADRTVVDAFVFYTVVDRPIVKERTTEYLDTQLIVREFAKQVRLVSIRELPKHSEKLRSEVIVLTADAASANPWLADRVVHNTAPGARTLPNSQSTENANTPVAGAPLYLRGGGDAGPSKSKNPFKKFIKLGRSSSKNQSSSAAKTPPASPLPGTPTTPVSANNPFGTFVKRNEDQAGPSRSSAIVPAAAATQNEPGKSKKSLKWFFSAPFSGPKPRPETSEPGLDSSEAMTPQNLDPQTQAAQKPTMKPFLDQSVSNSELGKEPWNVISRSEAEESPSASTSPQLPTKVIVPESVPSEPISSKSGGPSGKFTPLSGTKEQAPPSSSALLRYDATKHREQPALQRSSPRAQPHSSTAPQQGQALTSAALQKRDEATSSKPRNQIPMTRHTFERPNDGVGKGLFYSSTSQGGSSEVRSNQISWTSSSGSELSLQDDKPPQKAVTTSSEALLQPQTNDRPQASSSLALPATDPNTSISSAKAPQTEAPQGGVEGSTARSPRSPGVVLDSVQELPNTSQPQGVLPRSTILEKSYNAALIKCMDFIAADKQRATQSERTGEADIPVEYFYQIEEIKTQREVVETFAVHQHVLLEHVIKTVYLGERKSAPTIEMLSSRVLPYSPA